MRRTVRMKSVKTKVAMRLYTIYMCVCVQYGPVKMHRKGVALTDKFANYLQKVRGCGRSRTIGQRMGLRYVIDT